MGSVRVQCTHCSFEAVGRSMAEALERHSTHMDNKHSQSKGPTCSDAKVTICGTDAEKAQALSEAQQLGYTQADGSCQN